MSKNTAKDLYIQTGGVRLRYWEEGKTGNPIVLIHGLGAFIENWENNIQALSESHRVYAIDMVGCGLSDKPKCSYSIPYITKYLLEFLSIKNLTDVCIIGQSLGAGIALEAYANNPSIFKQMVLINVVGFDRKATIGLRILALPLVGELLSKPRRKTEEGFQHLLFFDQTFVKEETIDFYFERSKLPGAAHAYLSTIRSLGNFLGVGKKLVKRTKERALNIKIPVLILWGREDNILPVEQAYIAKKVIPNSRLEIFERCGHLPQIECAQKFNECVLDFLRI